MRSSDCLTDNGGMVARELKAAFQYYTVATKTPLRQLMRDALVSARNLGHDVFNALDLLDNKTILEVWMLDLDP